MKRSIISKGILLIFVVFVIVSPKHIKYEYSGVMFDNSDIEDNQHITFNIDGWLYRDLFFNEYFKGYIKLDGIERILYKGYDKEIYDELFNLKIKLEMRRSNFDMLQYNMMKGSYGYYQDIGDIYIGDNDKEFVITISKVDYKEEGFTSSSWSSKHGITIAMPARTRSEAVDLANSILFNLKEIK